MIKTVELRNFKRFKTETFDLTGNVILAGPNNSGKTTMIQAILTWNLAVRKWYQEKGTETRSKAKQRTGVQLISGEFTAIPIREMDLLWHGRSTGLKKDELGPGQKVGSPKHLEIILSGVHDGKAWKLGMQFTYRYSDLIFVRPTDNSDTDRVSDILENQSILVIPSFSGIGTSETRHDRPYQEMLIGMGKPGDLIRNKLLEVYERNGQKTWHELVEVVQEIFGYTLLPPKYSGLPFIIAEYLPNKVKLPLERPKSNEVVLDIASAGSGFLQVVLLLGFIYSQSASVVLLDEPDAHLHVILQKQVYDRLRKIFTENNSQLIIATHSEVVIDNSSPEGILSFYHSPHRLKAKFETEQVQAALRTLTSMDILFADIWSCILYLEGNSDFNLLREWAKVLEHPIYPYFNPNSENGAFWHNNIGRNPRNAKEHMFALKTINPNMKGILLLDGDARSLPDHEVKQDGLEIIRWRRYEAENYLLHPTTLIRFIAGSEESMNKPDLFIADKMQKAKKYLIDNISPNNYQNPFLDNDFQENVAASKNTLPNFFESCSHHLSKSDYYLIAAQMKEEEIHPEVKEKLDFLLTRFQNIT